MELLVPSRVEQTKEHHKSSQLEPYLSLKSPKSTQLTASNYTFPLKHVVVTDRPTNPKLTILGEIH